MFKTEKVYYLDSFLSSCMATVTGIEDNKVILDKTVAFPEGGGQIGDIGKLYIKERIIPFFDTKKGVGRILNIPDFPDIQVDTPVYHYIDKENLSKLSIGDTVKVEIDIEHRIRTTVLHSALHIALMVAKKRRPDLTKIIKGCKIGVDNARIDFFAKSKFLPEDIEWMSTAAQELIDAELPVHVYHHKDEEEAWYWQCEDFICPCGGTHITNTKQIGNIYIKRKNVGKTTERIIVSVENIKLCKDDYH